MSNLRLNKGRFESLQGPLLTIVMDGVGLSDFKEGNALHLAHTPNLDALFQKYGCLPILAHGKAVGLPSNGDMGNSEVGHNALGAGRIFEQGASLVQSAIDTQALFEGDTWRWLVDGVHHAQSTLHLIGLLSDGNVHSHENHLYALLKHAAQARLQRVRVHILLDGRDVSEVSALTYIDRLESVLEGINRGNSLFDYRIASGGGRMTTTMDRYEADWSMVERGWHAHVLGQGRTFTSARQAVSTFRDETPTIIDQFLPEFVIADDTGPVGRIQNGDSVCFFNFRGDRAIEISKAFEDDHFSGFSRDKVDVRYAGMMQYDGDLKLPRRFLVNPPQIDRPLSQYLTESQVRQFACSETQKFGHVTYFWNGNRSESFDQKYESTLEIPSDDQPFEHYPWMKAAEITDATLKAIEAGSFKYGRLNFANGDMVGHTGDLRATQLSLEALDLSLGRLLSGLKKAGGMALITADHGNAEQMFERNKKTGDIIYNSNGRPKALTSHTLNAVPCTLFDPLNQCPAQLNPHFESPGLANLASTTLELLGFQPPEEYKPSLLIPKG